MSEENTSSPGATVVGFELAGETCERWFNEEGHLRASGPPNVKRAIEAYVQAVARFLPNPVYTEYLCNVRPWGPDNDEIKLHAILELNHGTLSKNGKAGLKIVPEQVTAKVEELKKRIRLHVS
jgi:hypothetical protein